MGTGFSEVNIQPHRGGVWAAPGRLHVQSVCVLVHTGWSGGVGGGLGVSVVWSVALYPPCAGDACRIPAAAVALWSPATKAWRGQPL